MITHETIDKLDRLWSGIRTDAFRIGSDADRGRSTALCAGRVTLIHTGADLMFYSAIHRHMDEILEALRQRL